ncbi:DNA polymerase III subunit theta [Klebsiella pneumoniae]|nr:DNA polymerase III subunit theta [Klebsiella pneumoniae]
MSKWSIAAKPKDEQNKVNVDLAFSGVACKMRISELWTYGKQQLVSFMKKTSLLVCASLISTVVFALDNKQENSTFAYKLSHASGASQGSGNAN